MTEQGCWQQGGSDGCTVQPGTGRGGPCAPTAPNTQKGGLGGPSGAPLTSRSVSAGILEKAQVSARSCGPQGTITCHLFTFRRSPAVGISPDSAQPLLLFTSGNRPHHASHECPLSSLPSLPSFPTPETTREKQMQYI